MGETSTTDARPQLELVASEGEVLFPEPEPSVTFSDFWALYPRKIARKPAKDEWDRIDPDQYVPILIALFDWRRVWKDKEEDYIPHARTWLHQERWFDELPAAYRERRSAPVATALPKAEERRVPVPEHVKALIAKLKAGNK